MAPLTEEAAEFLARTADGDARICAHALELGLLTTEPDAEGRIVIDLDVAAAVHSEEGVPV